MFYTANFTVHYNYNHMIDRHSASPHACTAHMHTKKKECHQPTSAALVIPIERDAKEHILLFVVCGA